MILEPMSTPARASRRTRGGAKTRRASRQTALAEDPQVGLAHRPRPRAARHRGGGLPGLPGRRRPHPRTTSPSRADLDHLLQRRQDRDGPGSPDPEGDRVSVPRPPSRTMSKGPARRRGPPVLHPGRHLPDRHRPRDLVRPDRRPDSKAVRRSPSRYVKELLPLTQDQTISRKAKGDHHLHQGRRSDVQGRHPSRTTSTPSTTAEGPTASRRTLCPRILRQGCREADRRRRCRASPSVIRGPSLYDPALGAASRRNLRTGSPTFSTGWSPRAGSPPPERTSATMPKIIPPVTKRATGGPYPLPHRDGPKGAQGRPLARRRRHPSRRPAGRHDDRQARPGRHRRVGEEELRLRRRGQDLPHRGRRRAPGDGGDRRGVWRRRPSPSSTTRPRPISTPARPSSRSGSSARSTRASARRRGMTAAADALSRVLDAHHEL